MRRIVTFSSLYPSSVRPRNGIFVEQRLRQLLSSNQVQSKVIAPVPWFPSTAKMFGEYALFARTPAHEFRHDIEVFHPRFFMIPKVGMTTTPFFLARSAYKAMRELQKTYDFDLIDAHYYYPDGIAAVMLGKWLNKPVVITARGTDINYIPRYATQKKMILWAANESKASITVCQALKDEMIELGADGNKITVLRNGVDLNFFAPAPDREKLRQELAIKGKTLLSAGHLIERKGHHFAIEAMKTLSDFELLIIGEGEMDSQLKQLAQQCGVEQRVRFLGAMPQTELRRYYAAVDALILASSREGMANVLLESLACGTPVVATPLWGTPEVIAVPESGVLMHDRSTDALANAVKQLFAAYPDRSATRRYAEQYSWQTTTQGQIDLFNRICGSENKNV